MPSHKKENSVLQEDDVASTANEQQQQLHTGNHPRNSRAKHRESAASNFSRQRSLSRHRDSIGSNSVMSGSNYHNVDENDHEMFSGAASEIVPSSVSSFHRFNSHHNAYKSPRLSMTGINDNVPEGSSIPLDLELDDNTHKESLYDNDNLGMHKLSKTITNTSTRSANFRFFTQKEVEEAKGVSSYQYSANENLVDYDTNWNTYEEDYDDNESISSSVTDSPHLRYHSHHTHSHRKRKNTVGSSASVILSPRLSSSRGLDSSSSVISSPLVDSGNNGNDYGSTDDSDENDHRREMQSPRSFVGHNRNFNEDLLFNNNDLRDEDDDISDSEFLGFQQINNKKDAKIFELKFGIDEKYPCKIHFQRFYIAEEDLVVGIAGYSTSNIKQFFYYFICIITFGLGYLLLRWLPKYKIPLLGNPTALAKADWVVIETEFGQLDIIQMERYLYNKPLSTFLPLEKPEKDDINEDFVDTYEDSDPIIPILIKFEYRYMNLYYSPIEDLFTLNNDWVDPYWSKYPAILDGINEEVYKNRNLIFGSNLLDIKEKSVFQLLTDEILHPFYIFQVFSILLWLADNYYYYAFCIFLISIFSIVETLIDTKKSLKRMSEISRFICDVRVWRNGFWKEVKSSELVPGDIYEISDPSINVLPCDSILLTGDCIVNESMLTGESVPVSKISISQDLILDLELEFKKTKISTALSKSFLYNGTKVIRSRKTVNNEPSIGLVVKTGFNTTKGELVRSMLFPKPNGFKFYSDSFKYIGVMSVIAMLGFISSTINFIRLGLDWSVIILRALDLITIVVPPALPATLTIGTNFSLSRLREKNIFCIAPTRVNVGGKLDVMCFDKTGTLTEEGLDIMGVHVSKLIKDRNSYEFSDIIRDSEEIEVLDNKSRSFDLFLTMLTCHSLKVIENNDNFNDTSNVTVTREIIGDPLDFKMFEFLKWEMVEDSNDIELSKFFKSFKLPNNISPVLFRNEQYNNKKFIQLKEFEFVSQLRRMSVVVKEFDNDISLNNNNGKGNNEFKVYVKGAPEVLEKVCLSETLPVNYNELLHHYTHNGYRVIACASKTIVHNGNSNHKNDLSIINELSREDCESDLSFLGFIIFENKLKNSTKSSLNELSDAQIRNIMCTGDNVLTAISVAKECEMIQPDCKVYIPEFIDDSTFDANEQERDTAQGTDGDNGAEYSVAVDEYKPSIIWSEVDNPDLQLDPRTLVPLDINHDDNYCLAVTGDVFKYILTELKNDGDDDFNDAAVVDSESVTNNNNRNNNASYNNSPYNDILIEKMLMKGTIFARMSPDEKHELVEQLKSIDYTVGFCGDGANDCGALKAADVGISLSEAEASVASPFTSRVFEISCVLDVIKEGRSSLVTSFSCFQFMSLYSAIQFITVSILYKLGTNLGDFQFLFIDLFLIIPLAVFMSWSKPFPKLCIKRPTANLISPKIIIPLFGNILILLYFQLFIWNYVHTHYKDKDWYIKPIPGDDDEVKSTDNTVLFLFGNFQYILIGILLTTGPPYREKISKNKPFLVTVLVTILISIFLMNNNYFWLNDLMDITGISGELNYKILIISIINYILIEFLNKYLFKLIIEFYKKIVFGNRNIRKSKKKFKNLNKEFSKLIV
ncbi:hypothetical protein B5S30_g843 [[Candida] boidinii]|nr:hypothetical protein B5S30_g843 [[Candida] boidinii]